MRFFSLILLILAFAFCSNAQAKSALDYDYFAQIPIQHEGRIKPLDTFARQTLRTISGHERLDGMDASSWLAETIFDPAQALQRPIFHTTQAVNLNLPTREKPYYSYAEIVAMLQKHGQSIVQLAQSDEKTWTPEQAELMRLQEISILYTQLLRSFSFLLPLNIELPESLARAWKISPEKTFTLQEFRRYSAKLKDSIQKIVTRKGDNPQNYSEEELAIVRLSFEMNVLEEAGTNNTLFRIAPGAWNEGKDEWFSPWMLTKSGQANDKSAQYLKLWQNMAYAYLLQDPVAWNEVTDKTLKEASNYAPSTIKLELEKFYNETAPLTVALISYLLSFLCFLMTSIHRQKPWYSLSYGLLFLGGIFHATTIGVRIFILDRPPVGTLYESILFVSAICVLASLLMERRRKDMNGLIVGCLSGLGLLFIAQSFAQDDTMKMLVAVLNTNFWLATHVLCITMGYAWCLIVSILAHIWLLRSCLNKNASMLLPPIKALTLVALLFTAVGTILGGIWADQSWGRFWGWDPKENGALLIVLWIIWVLHARYSGHLKQISGMIALAALSIIVALAWFGVNLLNVGLHSYGFISGVAYSLLFFFLAETALLCSAFWILNKRRMA
ncbi:MAG: hypothetical protein DI551_01960 [Micavibrio aeruginosavorus]|uniref:Cytochrome c assembly protein domain-containing protein n=1 Tax=Micavibrio aeruginosavorus TaxID=349221 RepID=A0A2W5PU34_9BACT|nr:MAG: hypothetical protein DI551_01960 [Micavibrio aeruginosavorus]